MPTRAAIHVPVFEVDLAVNIARKKAAVDRALGGVPTSVHLVPLDFERDDLIGTLTRHGYRSDARTFFIWEGVTQYLTEDAVRSTLAPATAGVAGIHLSAGTSSTADMYGAELLYKRFRRPWAIGLDRTTRRLRRRTSGDSSNGESAGYRVHANPGRSWLGFREVYGNARARSADYPVALRLRRAIYGDHAYVTNALDGTVTVLDLTSTPSPL